MNNLCYLKKMRKKVKMKIKKISVKEFGKAMVNSYNNILMRKKKLSRAKAKRLLFVAALDRLENDADYRTVCKCSRIPDEVKTAYKERRQNEVMQEIITEIGGSYVFQL